MAKYLRKVDDTLVLSLSGRLKAKEATTTSVVLADTLSCPWHQRRACANSQLTRRVRLTSPRDLPCFRSTTIYFSLRVQREARSSMQCKAPLASIVSRHASSAGQCTVLGHNAAGHGTGIVHHAAAPHSCIVNGEERFK